MQVKLKIVSFVVRDGIIFHRPPVGHTLMERTCRGAEAGFGQAKIPEREDGLKVFNAQLGAPKGRHHEDVLAAKKRRIDDNPDLFSSYGSPYRMIEGFQAKVKNHLSGLIEGIETVDESFFQPAPGLKSLADFGATLLSEGTEVLTSTPAYVSAVSSFSERKGVTVKAYNALEGVDYLVDAWISQAKKNKEQGVPTCLLIQLGNPLGQMLNEEQSLKLNAAIKDGLFDSVFIDLAYADMIRGVDKAPNPLVGIEGSKGENTKWGIGVSASKGLSYASGRIAMLMTNEPKKLQHYINRHMSHVPVEPQYDLMDILDHRDWYIDKANTHMETTEDFANKLSQLVPTISGNTAPFSVGDFTAVMNELGLTPDGFLQLTRQHRIQGLMGSSMSVQNMDDVYVEKSGDGWPEGGLIRFAGCTILPGEVDEAIACVQAAINDKEGAKKLMAENPAYQLKTPMPIPAIHTSLLVKCGA